MCPRQSVSTDGHAVVGCVADERVVEFARFLELLQNATVLNVDIPVAGKLTARFVADRTFVAIPPDAAD